MEQKTGQKKSEKVKKNKRKIQKKVKKKKRKIQKKSLSPKRNQLFDFDFIWSFLIFQKLFLSENLNSRKKKGKIGNFTYYTFCFLQESVDFDEIEKINEM